MKSRHFLQSPFLIALEAATTCSLMDSGGPTKACRSLGEKIREIDYVVKFFREIRVQILNIL